MGNTKFIDKLTEGFEGEFKKIEVEVDFSDIERDIQIHIESMKKDGDIEIDAGYLRIVKNGDLYIPIVYETRYVFKPRF